MESDNVQEMDLKGIDNDSQQCTYLGTSENLEYCPECMKKNVLSKVKRLQYEQDKYWVVCVKGDTGTCYYLEEFQGKLAVTKEDLILYGLPGQLADHMDIYYDDLNKIVKFCISESLKEMYLSPHSSLGYDAEKIKDSVKDLADSHGLDVFKSPVQTERTSFETMNNAGIISSAETGVCDGSVEGNTDKILVDSCSNYSLNYLSKELENLNLTNYSPNSLSKELENLNLTESERMLLALPGFSDCDSSRQISQTTKTGESHIAKGEAEEDINRLFQKWDFNTDIIHLFRKWDDEPFEKLMLDDTCQETKVPYKSKKTRRRKHLPMSDDVLRILIELLVSDLSTSYQENLKISFAKIKGYKFPHDFVDNATSEKFPILKILEEEEKKAQLKPDMSERSKNFLSEMDSKFLS